MEIFTSTTSTETIGRRKERCVHNVYIMYKVASGILVQLYNSCTVRNEYKYKKRMGKEERGRGWKGEGRGNVGRKKEGERKGKKGARKGEGRGKEGARKEEGRGKEGVSRNLSGSGSRLYLRRRFNINNINVEHVLYIYQLLSWFLTHSAISHIFIFFFVSVKCVMRSLSLN